MPSDLGHYDLPVRRSSNWLPKCLFVTAILAVSMPLIALYGIPTLVSTTATRNTVADAIATPAVRLRGEELASQANEVARNVNLRRTDLEGLGYALDVLEAARRAVKALPEIASTAASVAADLNETRGELTRTRSRLDTAFAALGRQERQLAALQEPWAGHNGEVLCSKGHRCTAYIDAGKTNLTALMSVAACRDYCTRAYPAANFFAFHNEFGWTAFMLDPKGRCRCFDQSPCELVPDGGYNLWTGAGKCTLDLLPPEERAAAANLVIGGHTEAST